MHGARLEVSDAMGRTQVVPIVDDRVTIGRSHSNMLSLDGAEVSRRHAEIVKDGDRYTLRDVGSVAGTFVNDERVTEHTLGHGDHIRIGRHADLRFLLEETPDSDTRATTSASAACARPPRCSNGSAPWAPPRCSTSCWPG